MTFQRKLGPLERLAVAGGQRSPFVMNLIIEGTGALDREAFTKAAARAGAANPGARLVLRGLGPWSRWVDSERDVPVQVIDAPWSGRGEDASFLQESMDVRDGPLCEVLLLPGAPARVVLRVHHAIMDGIGMGFFAVELFRALRGEPLLGSPSTLNELEAARALGVGRSSRWRSVGIPPTGAARGESAGLSWTRISIPRRTRAAIAPVALALAQAAREHGQGPVHIQVVTDLRKRHEPPFSIANLTGIIPLEVAPEDDLRAIKRKLIASLRVHEDAGYMHEAAVFRFLPLSLLRLIIGRQAAGARKRGLHVPSAIISFIEVDEAMFSGGGFVAERIVGLPPLGETVACFAGMVSTRTATEVALAIPDALASEGRALALAARIDQALRGTNSSDAPESR